MRRHKFQLDPLPYDFKALEPIISAETLKLHYDKHHRGYVDKLNELLEKSEFQDASLETIVCHSEGDLFNQAGQHWNHTFFWKCMVPHRDATKPSGRLLTAIKNDFDSLSQFKLDFEQEGQELFGSGWVWLVKRLHGGLEIISTQDADTPIRHGWIPLLVCDVWEHAYYLDYQNQRAQFLNYFWNVVNWDFVSENYVKSMDADMHAEPHMLI